MKVRIFILYIKKFTQHSLLYVRLNIKRHNRCNFKQFITEYSTNSYNEYKFFKNKVCKWYDSLSKNSLKFVATSWTGIVVFKPSFNANLTESVLTITIETHHISTDFNFFHAYHTLITNK